MRRISALALHFTAWTLSMPLFGAISTWLSRAQRIQTPDWGLFTYIAVMLIWAIWIFERTFSLRPFSARKLMEIVAYSILVLVAFTTGLLVTYIFIVIFLGGE
jgi:hypothetical protein